MYEGGDRHSRVTNDYYDKVNFDFDKFSRSSFKDLNSGPYVMMESFSVLGNLPHVLAKSDKKRVMLTFSEDFAQRPDYQLHIPYDFESIQPLKTSNPLDRPALAFYCFGRKSFNCDLPACAVDTYKLRYEIARLPLVNTADVGPSMYDKLHELHKHRFGIACENCVAKGYITEKLFDCFTANVVPIYIGAKLPPKLEACVLHVNHATVESILFAIRNCNEQLYMQLLNKGMALYDSGWLEENYGCAAWSTKVNQFIAVTQH